MYRGSIYALEIVNESEKRAKLARVNWVSHLNVVVVPGGLS